MHFYLETCILWWRFNSNKEIFLSTIQVWQCEQFKDKIIQFLRFYKIAQHFFTRSVNASWKWIDVSPNDNWGVFCCGVLFIHKSRIKWQRCAGLCEKGQQERQVAYRYASEGHLGKGSLALWLVVATGEGNLYT